MIKQDDRREIHDLNVNTLSNKKDIRKYLLKIWSDEEESIWFRYFVETLADGKRIYLERPANLNKGCDFVIKVENLILFQNGNDKPPKHEYLLNLIESNKLKLINLRNELSNVYNCQSIATTYVNIEHEIILKLSKWFFIEQDITYWANSGRKMLWNAIEKEL